jgi:hypothetical protein
MLSLAASGCDPLGLKRLSTPITTLEPGQIAEISDPVSVRVLVTDKKTGAKKICVLRAWPGYVVGRER